MLFASETLLRSSSDGTDARVEDELVVAVDDNEDVAEREGADPAVLLSPTELLIDVFEPEAEANGAETETFFTGSW